MRNMGLAEFGHKELCPAEHEILGLMTCCGEFGFVQSFRCLNTHVSLHMTILTDGLDEALQVHSATVRWTSYHVFSTQVHAAVGIAKADIFTDVSWNGRALPEYWQFTEQRLTVPGAVGYRSFTGLSIDGNLHMILQSGGFIEIVHVLGATVQFAS